MQTQSSHCHAQPEAPIWEEFPAGHGKCHQLSCRHVSLESIMPRLSFCTPAL